MDNSIIPVPFPTLDDQTAAKLHEVLYALLETFESYYYHQIERYEQDVKVLDDFIDNLTDDQDPF